MGDIINTRCLDEKALSSYLDEKLPRQKREEIEAHIACCNACLSLLLVSYEACKGKKRCPEILRNRIKNRLGLKQEKKRPELKWLVMAIISLGASFIFRHYFLQFLAASIILGFKWVMEGEGAKRVIMIFKGAQEKEKKLKENLPSRVSNVAGGDRYDKPE